MKKRQSEASNWSGEETTLRSNKLLEGSGISQSELFHTAVSQVQVRENEDAFIITALGCIRVMII